MVNAGEDLCDGCGIWNHAAGAHDLGQVAPGDNCRWLVVDAALEASWAPVHKLNGTLGLDGSHSCVDILWHHVSLEANYRYERCATLAMGKRTSHCNSMCQLLPCTGFQLVWNCSFMVAMVWSKPYYVAYWLSDLNASSLLNICMLWWRLSTINGCLLLFLPAGVQWFGSCYQPSILDTSCSMPCTCRDEDRTSPSWRQAQRQTWWSLPLTTARGMPSLLRSQARRMSAWSECVDMEPNSFGTL